MYPAVFLDRDGTIIEDRGYLKYPSEIIIFPESFEALNLLQKHFLLFIITNQSGISKGITSKEEVIRVNLFLLDSFKLQGISIADVFYCPHKTEDNCICKKPSPYFINIAAETYNLDLSSSFIMGDHPSDAICGINAGIEPVHLLTGHGKEHLLEVPSGVKVCQNILEGANYMIQRMKFQK